MGYVVHENSVKQIVASLGIESFFVERVVNFQYAIFKKDHDNHKKMHGLKNFNIFLIKKKTKKHFTEILQLKHSIVNLHRLRHSKLLNYHQFLENVLTVKNSQKINPKFENNGDFL